MNTDYKRNQDSLKQLRLDVIKGLFGRVTDNNFLHIIKHYNIYPSLTELMNIREAYLATLKDFYSSIGANNPCYAKLLQSYTIDYEKKSKLINKYHLAFYCISKNSTPFINAKTLHHIKHDLLTLERKKICKRLGQVASTYFYYSNDNKNQINQCIKKLENNTF